MIRHLTEAFELYEEKDERRLMDKTLKLILSDESTKELQQGESSGIPLLDDLRQEIYVTYSHLNKLFTTSAPTEELNQISTNLMQLMLRDLLLEEQIMGIFKYPNITEHTAEHDSFRSQLTKFSAAENTNQHNMLIQMIYFGLWLEHHEKWADKRLAMFLSQQEIESLSVKLLDKSNTNGKIDRIADG